MPTRNMHLMTDPRQGTHRDEGAAAVVCEREQRLAALGKLHTLDAPALYSVQELAVAPLHAQQSRQRHSRASQRLNSGHQAHDCA
jgi:hypothetical protein